MLKEIVQKNLIYHCRTGSYSYGTNIEGSDIDTKGVYIAPRNHVISIQRQGEQVDSEDPDKDETIYELRQFMRLAMANNPNILDLLYCDESDILDITWPFQLLRDNRHLFLSKRSRFTFAGFAFSQLKRIKGHKKWISNPQSPEPPKLGAFCRFIGPDGKVVRDESTIREIQKDCFLAETFGGSQFRVYKSPEFFADKLGFFTEDELQTRHVNVHEDILAQKAHFVGVLWVNLDEFKAKHAEWKNYWQWKNNRNPARAILEEKSGYDCKHALHLIRLMRMSEEILTTGQVLVKRPDAKELIEIRNGKLTYDELIEWAEGVEEKLNAAYKSSTLQHSPDVNAIDDLYREIVIKYWSDNEPY